MMLLYRLVRLIEGHSQALAACLLTRVQECERAPDFRNVPTEELRERVHEIYLHLGDWLMGKSEFDIEQRYLEIGARRARQHVPLSQLATVIFLTKENLWDFLMKESTMNRPVEVFSELELLQMLDQFFDHAVYWSAVGYERELAAGLSKPLAAGKTA